MRAKYLGMFNLAFLSLLLISAFNAINYNGLVHAGFYEIYQFITTDSMFVFFFFFISVIHLSYYLLKEEEFELPTSFVLLVSLFALKVTPGIVNSISSFIAKVGWIDLQVWTIVTFLMKVSFIVFLIILLLFCFKFLTTGKEIKFQWPFGKK